MCNTRISFIIMLMLTFVYCATAQAFDMRSIDQGKMTVCPSMENSDQQPDFTAPACKIKRLGQVNPQNRQLWLKTTINIKQQPQQPLAIYVFGKTSSEIYFNGFYLGKNGTPSSQAKDEFAGNIDSHFYLPPRHIKVGDNEIIMRLSAHHGFLQLGYPVSFIGIGQYTDPRSFMFSSVVISLVLFGALLLGGLYFAVLALRSSDNNYYRLFVLMAVFATAQLFAEMCRGLLNYSYPWHDIRLLAIVILALGFGLTLLAYTIKRFSHQQINWWNGTAVITLVTTILLPGFNGKTALAILIPALSSTVLLAVCSLNKVSRANHSYWVT